MKIISCVNNKGGVGKTTFSERIAIELASRDNRVLVIDCDPQGNLTSQFLKVDNYKTLFDVLEDIDFDINQAIYQSNSDNIKIIPNNFQSKYIEVVLSSKSSQTNVHTVLKRQLKKVKDDFDYIIIDSPTSMGFVRNNIVLTSNQVIIPIIPAYFSLDGINELLKDINRINDEFDNEIDKVSIVVNMVDKRNSIDREIVETITNSSDNFYAKTIIPKRADIENARVEQIALEKKNKNIINSFKSLVDEVI
jgi:chromosome partitioning protein